MLRWRLCSAWRHRSQRRAHGWRLQRFQRRELMPHPTCMSLAVSSFMHEFFSLSKIMDVDGSNSSPTASIAHHRDLFPYEANCLVKTVDPNLICIKVDKRDIIKHVGNIPLNNKYVCWEYNSWWYEKSLLWLLIFCSSDLELTRRQPNEKGYVDVDFVFLMGHVHVPVELLVCTFAVVNLLEQTVD